MLCMPLPLDWGCLEVLRTALTHPHGHPDPKTGLAALVSDMPAEGGWFSDHILHAETESSRRKQSGKKNGAPRRQSPRARCGGEAEVKARVDTKCIHMFADGFSGKSLSYGSGSPRGDKSRRTSCPGQKWALVFLDGSFTTPHTGSAQ